MKSKIQNQKSKIATDTRYALAIGLLFVILMGSALSACNTEPTNVPAAALNPGSSYTSEASPGATAERTAEKVRVQWLIADKTTVQKGGLDVQGAATFSGGTTLDSLTVSGATALDGGITADTTAFTVADTTGDVATAGDITAGDDVTITGRINVTGTAALNSSLTVAGTAAVTGLTTLTGGFKAGADGNMQANQLYFDLGHVSYIDASAGNLDITVPATGTVDIENGGLTVAGDVTVNGVKLVTASSGDVTLKAGASIYPTTAVTNTGTMFTCAAPLVYTNTTATGICVVPANANIVDALLSISTLFNDSGTDLIDCGITFADPNEFFNDTNGAVAAVGRLASTGALGDVGASAKTVWCKYIGQNSDASAGAATVLIFYVVD